MMFRARMLISAVVMLMATMVASTARAESYFGSIEGNVTISKRYSGSPPYLDPSDSYYQPIEYTGKGTINFSFGFSLPSSKEFSVFAYGLSYSIGDVHISSTPDAIAFAYSGPSNSPFNQIDGYSSYSTKGFYQNSTFSLGDRTGTYFDLGVPVPGMTIYASARQSSDVGSTSGTIIAETYVSFSGTVAPAPIAVPEPSAIVLVSFAGLCGLAAMVRRNPRVGGVHAVDVPRDPSSVTLTAS